MTNSGKVFADELTYWLLEAGLIQSQCQMSIYYKYAPDGSKIVVLSYADDCVAVKYSSPPPVAADAPNDGPVAIFVCGGFPNVNTSADRSITHGGRSVTSSPISSYRYYCSSSSYYCPSFPPPPSTASAVIRNDDAGMDADDNDGDNYGRELAEAAMINI